MLTEDDILTALRDCYDPALPCNIVDLGLVQKITITPDADAPGAGIPGVPQKHHIQIALILTSPTEEAASQLSAQIANCLAGIEQVSHTAVAVLDSPVWSPTRITSTGRRILGLDGNPSLVQIR